METVFMLFEGVCPTCGAETDIVEVSGTRQFLTEQQFSGTFEQRTWEEVGDGLDSNGMVAFRCPEGHYHEAYHSPGGDWVA